MTDAAPSRSEVLQGTLEMLTLKALTLQPMHGWGISIRLRQISGDVFDVNQGSLYPALQRMLRRGWIRASDADRWPGITHSARRSTPSRDAAARSARWPTRCAFTSRWRPAGS